MAKGKEIKKASFLCVLFILVCHHYVFAQDFIFDQLDDAWGLVVMEAEHYSMMDIPGAEYFEPVTEPDFYTGEGAMMAMPESTVFADASEALAGSPVLNYYINFIRADSVFIWIRGCHADGGDDSFHAGIDGEILPTTERIGYHGEPYGVWDWLGIAMNNAKPVFYVDTPGIHIFQVFIREGGFKFDKFVLTTSRDYDPLLVHGEMGPEETLTSVEQPAVSPEKVALYQNFPNPFNPVTKISYSLNEPGHVRLSIYNLSGEQVACLVNEVQNSGRHHVIWNTFEAKYRQLVSGVYFAQLMTVSQNKTIRCMLMK
ncbi:T9SS type A sorting domain-containing protein [bacterium]|nr:T9SS type A sorting domain-containing protein [bacterium]